MAPGPALPLELPVEELTPGQAEPGNTSELTPLLLGYRAVGEADELQEVSERQLFDCWRFFQGPPLAQVHPAPWPRRSVSSEDET